MTSPFRDPLVAGLLGLVPGAGHLYAGARSRGLTFLMGTVAGLLLFVVPGVLIWAVSIADAVACARRANQEAPPLPLPVSDLPECLAIPEITDGVGPEGISLPAPPSLYPAPPEDDDRPRVPSAESAR